jgi:AcrR family transcriptional regulator
LEHTAIETNPGCCRSHLCERGYQGTTLDDIAAAANISRSTHSYFASKEELLHRIYHEVISTTQAAVARLAGEDRPAPEKLRRIIRYLISYLAAHTSLAQVFFSEHFNLSGTTGRAVMRANRTFTETIARVFEEGGRTGALTPLHPKRFTFILLGICNWMHRWYQPDGEWTPEIIAEEVITLRAGQPAAGEGVSPDVP